MESIFSPAAAARTALHGRLRLVAAAAVVVLATTAPGLGPAAASVPATLASIDGSAGALVGFDPGGLVPVTGGGRSVQFSWPDPEPDIGSDSAEAGAPAAAVEALHPAIRLTGQPRSLRDPAVLARHVEGVELATSVLLGTMKLALGEEDREVEVAGVAPAFRLFTPQVTASAVDVWRRIGEGDAAFVHEVGQDLQHEHGIELGDRVPVAVTSADDAGDVEAAAAADEGPELPTVRVGAYASNGAPPVADVVMSRRAAADLGITGETVVLVAVADGADPEVVAAALEERTGLEAEVVPPPAVRRAFLSGSATREAFEPFRYVSLGDGMIQIEGDWVRRNIVSAQVPIFRGHVTCHRLMIPQLRGALQEIEDRGLAHLIDPSQYGGCWVPRHILFNPARTLSMHAWGLAIDFNVSTNQFGAQPQLDLRIVEIFERWGFSWGGHWSIPDGMHFELAVLLDTGGQ